MHRGARFTILIAVLLAGCGSTTTSTSTSTPAVAVDEEPVVTTTVTAPTTSTSVDDATETAPALPVTIVDHVGNEVTIESVDRIIPLDGTVAEVVFALGLGDNVVATDLSATYPPEADALPEIGYQRSLTAESIAQFAPTVLLATDIAGPEGTIDDLRRLGYPLVIVPNDASAAGPAEKIRAVATALGVPARGEALAGELDEAIAATRTTPGDHAPVVVALYLRGESTQLVLGREAATDWLIEAAGGVNVADLLDIDETAPVSAEAILAVAPDIIIVPAAGLDSVGGIEGLMGVGGLGETPAGRNRAVITHDDQLLLGNGPRTGALLADLRSAFEELTTP
ncbi:MAG: ABC transporter substrate-binding protein [Actinomycetota bacterium]